MRHGALMLCLLASAAACTEQGLAGASPAPVSLEEEGPIEVARLPAEFEGWRNPLPDTAAVSARGELVFVTNCAPCHGKEGDGRGPAAKGLDPPPADFTDGSRLAPLPDDFVFYRITKGKRGTAMPAFGATLSGDDRAALIRFLRRLSPSPSGSTIVERAVQ